jgi:hypothetical protein
MRSPESLIAAATSSEATAEAANTAAAAAAQVAGWSGLATGTMRLNNVAGDPGGHAELGQVERESDARMVALTAQHEAGPDDPPRHYGFG